MSVRESIDALVENAVKWETLRCYEIADKIADIAIEQGVSTRAWEAIMKLLKELKGGGA